MLIVKAAQLIQQLFNLYKIKYAIMQNVEWSSEKKQKKIRLS